MYVIKIGYIVALGFVWYCSLTN